MTDNAVRPGLDGLQVEISHVPGARHEDDRFALRAAGLDLGLFVMRPRPDVDDVARLGRTYRYDRIAVGKIMSEKNYVRADEHGAMRVGSTSVMLDSIVAAFDEGHSAKTIHQQYPTLTLEEIHRAVTYYLSYADEVGEYLKRQGALWEKRRRESASQTNPVVDRLQASRATDASRD